MAFMSDKDGTNHAHETRGSLEELYTLLKEFGVAMLVTVTPEHQLRARPMALQDPSEVPDADLWLVTGDDTSKVYEINKEHQVCICTYRSRDAAYVSISALATFDKNREEIKRLYKPSWKAWFTEGENDPTITLLKLKVEHAEYWEPTGGRPRILFEKVKSMLTGEPADKNLNPPKHV